MEVKIQFDEKLRTDLLGFYSKGLQEDLVIRPTKLFFSSQTFNFSCFLLVHFRAIECFHKLVINKHSLKLNSKNWKTEKKSLTPEFHFYQFQDQQSPCARSQSGSGLYTKIRT